MGVVHLVKVKAKVAIWKAIVKDFKDFCAAFKLDWTALRGKRLRLAVDLPCVLFHAWTRDEAELLRRLARRNAVDNFEFRAVKDALQPAIRLALILVEAKEVGLIGDLDVVFLAEVPNDDAPRVKVRPVAKGDTYQLEATLLASDAQPKKGRKASVSFRRFLKALRGFLVLDRHMRVQVLFDHLLEDIIHLMTAPDADPHLFLYEAERLPDYQFAIMGNFNAGDSDIFATLAIAPHGMRLFGILRASTEVEHEIEVVDCLEARALIVSSMVPEFTALLKNGDEQGFTLPFSSLRDKETGQWRFGLFLCWLVAHIVFSLSGFQDYAERVFVKRKGKDDKVMWSSTFCRALDRWFVELYKEHGSSSGSSLPKLNLDQFRKRFPLLASGMLLGVTKSILFFDKFWREMSRSICQAGEVSLIITRQGAEAIHVFRAFCEGSLGNLQSRGYVLIDPVEPERNNHKPDLETAGKKFQDDHTKGFRLVKPKRPPHKQVKRSYPHIGNGSFSVLSPI